MSVQNGTYQNDTVEQILDAMMADAEQYFGPDLKQSEQSVIRTFYRPVAEFLAGIQEDIGLVLRSTQIDHAEGGALDLLTALIGIIREPAKIATGTVTFSRSDAAARDYVIPEGTTVQTDSNDPKKYVTTDTATLLSGSTSVDANIKAIDGGVEYNAGANTVTIVPSPPAGIEEVTNANEITGGSDREDDDELRRRAKEELAIGACASAPALVNSVLNLDDVSDAVIYINDTSTDNTGSGGLPDHSFELVVVGGADQDIADTIMHTKAAGDTSYGGSNGTKVTADTTLTNGQTFPIDFSRPTTVQIYVDADYTITESYVGDDEVMDNIVEYIGGTLTSGNEDPGRLAIGEDVLIGEVEYAIRSTPGVYDINSLSIGTSSSPTGTSNISVASSEGAIANATDSSITVTTTQV